MQKSYFQDSFTLKKELDLQKIPSNALLFICDATSMYTNIKKVPSLHRIGQFSRENEKHLTVPPTVLMDALHLLMTNNVFQSGDMYWIQNVGTEMGAQPATLVPQYSSASTKRQCLHSSETSSNCIVDSLTTSYAFGWLTPNQPKTTDNGRPSSN